VLNQLRPVIDALRETVNAAEVVRPGAIPVAVVAPVGREHASRAIDAK
jgi:hypothetical protein